MRESYGVQSSSRLQSSGGQTLKPLEPVVVYEWTNERRAWERFAESRDAARLVQKGSPVGHLWHPPARAALPTYGEYEAAGLLVKARPLFVISSPFVFSFFVWPIMLFGPHVSPLADACKSSIPGREQFTV
ncbi:hypothetical protein M431DRAFT_491839 [Trichoderma harzianum CBS 226.95]|uniref:Uncharacterized protein n=1 Tax=Trichoderma harzianum CBS 226.95 TaxID=983964 RepID=A0A2T4AKK0_TRIHA|nr:hypothetical protein M431DRAFT_491839 [Trichoderma harzianum CBS 226.95]PTB57604.1 hypothetical protein M431DRAFT_491839 [Trichoderma harzianum CBS 226.95]